MVEKSLQSSPPPGKPLNVVHARSDMIRWRIEQTEVEFGGHRLKVTVSLGNTMLNPAQEPVSSKDFLQFADIGSTKQNVPAATA